MLLTINNLFRNKLWKLCILFLILLIIVKDNHKSLPSLSILPEKFHTSFPTYKEIPVFKQIILETNWNAKTALKKLYVVGINEDGSLLSYYSLSEEILKKRGKIKKHKTDKVSIFYIKTKEKNIKPTGYFIIRHLKRFEDWIWGDLQKQWKQYLSHSPFILNFIQEEIKTGKLLIQIPKLYSQYWLIPYQATKRSFFPEGFTNRGQPYYWEEVDWINNCNITSHFVRDDGFYYCMILPGYLQRAGVHIKFSKHIKNYMEIFFSGPLLGLKESAANLDGVSFWTDIQIILSCNKNHLYSLPDIGYNSQGEYDDIRDTTNALNSTFKT